MRHRNPRQAGFSLVEVMVALIVVSIGMLGIAKMQALAMASTGSARMRSLTAISAASLGSAMHANRTYWGSTVANFTVTVSSGGDVTSTSDAALNSTRGVRQACISSATPCTAVQMAASDLGDWADSVYAAVNYASTSTSNPILPNGSTTITCAAPAPTATPPTPGSCRIWILWTESRVASDTGRDTTVDNATNNANLHGTAATQYILWVDP